MKENQDSNNGSGEAGKENGEDDSGGDVFDGVPEAPLPPPPPPSGHRPRSIDFGQGSGIIFDDGATGEGGRGLILTNAHVVDGATRIYILLTDGRRFRAEVRGSDDIVDVAVLQIVADDDAAEESETAKEEAPFPPLHLPVATLGNSDSLEVGRFVVAVGSPGGLDNTCTIGIVSGLKRCPKLVGIPDKTGALDYIQTDAAINQGNSGGPLVDVETGEVVGINTCIRANMEGTSFAIPINKVRGIARDLAEGRRVTHGYLGVHMSTMNPSLARHCNEIRAARDGRTIPEKDGVMIEKVSAFIINMRECTANLYTQQILFFSPLSTPHVPNPRRSHRSSKSRQPKRAA